MVLAHIDDNVNDEDDVYIERLVGWLVGWLDFYDISTFVGYLMPNPFLYK